MADREKLDKIKEKTGISTLDEKTRKDLFNKFVEAGGEVIDERQKRRMMTIDRQKQHELRKRMDDHSRKLKTSSTAPAARKKTVQPRQKIPARSAPSPGFWTRLRIRFNLKYLRIAQFNGLYFEHRFLEKFNNLYKPALMEIQVMYLDLFKTRAGRGNAMMRRMDSMRPLYYELIEMTGSIFDRMIIEPIVDHYTTFPNVPKKVSELYDPLMDIYRRLLVLKPFENTILKSFEIAIDLGTKYADKDGEKNTSYPSYRKKVKNSLFILFHKLLPRLHWLFCHYQGFIFDMSDAEVEKILGISISEKPGNRRAIKPDEEEENTVPDNEQAQEIPEHEQMPEHIRKGLELMGELNLSTLRREYDKKGLFFDVPDTDKVLATYLLFSEFDREYSPVFTTSKIKYNMDFGSGGKFDFRSRMQDLYDLMRPCSDSMRDYADSVALYERARAEKPESSSQYISYSKRLEAIQKKKISTGKTSRQKVSQYMTKVEETIEALIDDMNSQQRFLANPQDVLEFEPNIEGDKKINGLKVYEAISRLHAFSGAFAYRLSAEGDLSGKLQFEESGTETASSGTTEQAGDAGDTAQKAEKPAAGKSILDELDDLL